MKDYGMAMEFDTDEIWRKLSDGKPLSDYPEYDRLEYETAQTYTESDLILAYAALDRLCKGLRKK